MDGKVLFFLFLTGTGFLLARAEDDECSVESIRANEDIQSCLMDMIMGYYQDDYWDKVSDQDKACLMLDDLGFCILIEDDSCADVIGDVLRQYEDQAEAEGIDFTQCTIYQETVNGGFD